MGNLIRQYLICAFLAFLGGFGQPLFALDAPRPDPKAPLAEALEELSSWVEGETQEIETIDPELNSPDQHAANRSFLSPSGIPETELTGPVLFERIREAATSLGQDPKNLLITFIHDGSRIPAEQRWLIAYLKQNNLNVRVLRKGKKSDTEKFRAIEEETVASKLFLEFVHQANAQPEIKKLIDEGQLTEWRLRRILRRWSANVRGFFGLQKGISYSMYFDDKLGVRRPLKESIAELANGAVVGAMVAAITYQALLEQSHEHPELNVIAAAVTAWLCELFWGYNDRAISAFRSQGKDYKDDARKAIDTNRAWFWLTTFNDAVIKKCLVQWALRGPNFGLDTLLFTAYNAALSIPAKILPKLWIAKNQDNGDQRTHDTGSQRHGVWKTIVLNGLLSTFNQTLAVNHLFQGAVGSGSWASWFQQSAAAIFVGLAVAGLAYEAYVHFFGMDHPFSPYRKQGFFEIFRKRLKKDLRNLQDSLGIKPHRQCATHLYLRPLTPEELYLKEGAKRKTLSPDETRVWKKAKIL